MRILCNSISFFLPKANPENSFRFVKIIPKENGNFDLALRKRLFCNAKPTLLPCKTAAFAMQNNRFCKTLKTSLLHNRHIHEKYLQLCNAFSAFKISCPTKYSVLQQHSLRSQRRLCCYVYLCKRACLIYIVWCLLLVYVLDNRYRQCASNEG